MFTFFNTWTMDKISMILRNYFVRNSCCFLEQLIEPRSPFTAENDVGPVRQISDKAEPSQHYILRELSKSERFFAVFIYVFSLGSIMIESGFRRTFIRFYWVFSSFSTMHVFVWDVSFFSTFASRFSFVIFLVGFLIFFFLLHGFLLFEIIPVIMSVGAFFLRFLFHCRYSKCMCSSMKWLVQLPWNIVSAKVFFFVDSNAFRRNIKQVMSMNSKNHSINNRKNGWGKWWLITFASSL